MCWACLKLLSPAGVTYHLLQRIVGRNRQKIVPVLLLQEILALFNIMHLVHYIRIGLPVRRVIVAVKSY